LSIVDRRRYPNGTRPGVAREPTVREADQRAGIRLSRCPRRAMLAHMVKPTIRRWSADDWAACRDLRLAALADAPLAFASTLQREQEFTEAQWRAGLGRRAQFAAYLAERPVGGAAGVRWDDPATADLVAMWVRPQARGKGVADLLVRAVVDWADGQGHAKVRLWVSEGNEPAVRLYLRHGFARTGEVQPHPNEPASREFAMVRYR